MWLVSRLHASVIEQFCGHICILHDILGLSTVKPAERGVGKSRTGRWGRTSTLGRLIWGLLNYLFISKRVTVVNDVLETQMSLRRALRKWTMPVAELLLGAGDGKNICILVFFLFYVLHVSLRCDSTFHNINGLQ